MNYLYNSVPLPALPKEWNKEECPLAFMTVGMLYGTTPEYRLYFMNGDIRINMKLHSIDISNGKGMSYKCRPNSQTEFVLSSEAFTHSSNIGDAVWANYDVYDSYDGSLIMAASDPIPVTPAEPIDSTAMLMGWLAGERIVGMRGNVVQPEQPSGVYDDAFPIEWNILGTGGNAGFTLDGENFVKVSNLAPSSLANMSVSAQYQGQTFDFVMTEAENNDSFAGSATWSLAYFYCEEMDITLKMHSLSAGFTLGAWVVPEAGLYVTDFSAMGLSVDVTIEETV